MQTSTKIIITRNVLLFSAIVVGIISVYTTVLVFTSPEIDLSFSPPANNEIGNETNQSSGTFDIEGKFPDDFEKNGEDKVYKSGTIPPHDSSVQTSPSPINLLMTFENLDSGQSVKILFMIVIEILVIYLVYRELDIRIIGDKLRLKSD